MQTLSDKDKKIEHYKKYEDYCKRAIRAAEEIKGKNLSELSNSALAGLYKFLKKETNDAMGMPNIDLDIFDIVFEGFLQEKIKSKLSRFKGRDKVLSDIYRELSTTVYSTFVSQEEKAIARLALKDNVAEEDVRKIYDNFWWVSLGWENIIPRNLDYYKNEIRKYSKKKNLRGLIKEIENRPHSVAKKRNDMIRKYKLGKEVKELLEILDKFSYFHDLRKETQVKAVYSLDLLLFEVAKRFGIGKEEREWYTHNEIIGVLMGKKINTEEIGKRKKAILVIVEESGIKMFSGDKAMKIRKKELEQKIDEGIKELKGLGVARGIVRAHAKVCNGIQDAKRKIRRGDILVTGMTLPDYVPVMKIAGAIITDEGGITCHAAVVCRELNKPCVVGTKVATQVLRDGDLIEVDANKGIVKILKRK